MKPRLARGIRERQDARLVLIVGHHGDVQISTCQSCTGDVEEIARILGTCAATALEHPEGGDLGEVP